MLRHDLQLRITGTGPDVARPLISGQEVSVGPTDAERYRPVKVPPVNHWEAIVFEAKMPLSMSTTS